MDNQSGEALVILKSPTASKITDSIATRAKVTQIASPRVFVVSSDHSSLNAIAQLAGVANVLTEPDAPLPDISWLDQNERLFIKGWLMARQPKTRGKGEGLSWDAPGFLPPDPPKR
jgi:hypothetical protein